MRPGAEVAHATDYRRVTRMLYTEKQEKPIKTCYSFLAGGSAKLVRAVLTTRRDSQEL